MNNPSPQWTKRFPIWNWLRSKRPSWKLGMLGAMVGVTLIAANVNKRPPVQLDPGTYIGYFIGTATLVIGSLVVVGISLGSVYERYFYRRSRVDEIDEPPTD